MERYEHTERGAAVESIQPRLQSENSTKQGLSVIKQEELRRAQPHGGDLPEVEIFGGELTKRSESVDKAGRGLGDGKAGLTRKELDECMKNLKRFSPEQQQTLIFLSDNYELIRDLAPDGTPGITFADTKAYDARTGGMKDDIAAKQSLDNIISLGKTAEPQEFTGTKATEQRGISPASEAAAGPKPSERAAIDEIAETWRRMSWEPEGKVNNHMSKPELSRLIAEGETAGGRKLTEPELKVLKVIEANYDDLNALSISTDPNQQKATLLNQLSGPDFDRLQEHQKELDARREMEAYFSSDANFKKFENISDDYSYYYGREPEGFISYNDMMSGTPDEFSKQDGRMLRAIFKASTGIAAAKADGDSYTGKMLSQADFHAWRQNYSNNKIKGSNRTVGQLLSDLEQQLK